MGGTTALCTVIGTGQNQKYMYDCVPENQGVWILDPVTSIIFVDFYEEWFITFGMTAEVANRFNLGTNTQSQIRYYGFQAPEDKDKKCPKLGQPSFNGQGTFTNVVTTCIEFIPTSTVSSTTPTTITSTTPTTITSTTTTTTTTTTTLELSLSTEKTSESKQLEICLLLEFPSLISYHPDLADNQTALYKHSSKNIEMMFSEGLRTDLNFFKIDVDDLKISFSPLPEARFIRHLFEGSQIQLILKLSTKVIGPDHDENLQQLIVSA